MPKQFFDGSADEYDREVAAMPRRYKDAHRLQNDLVLRTLRNSVSKIVVDFGCATGADGEIILSRRGDANYVGIDESQAQLDRARCRLETRADRSLLINAGFLDVDGHGLSDATDQTFSNRNVACVISAFSLHHCAPSERQHVYSAAFAVLEPGGLMVVTDLFANVDAGLSEQALQIEIADIRRWRKRLGRLAAEIETYTTVRVGHYSEENQLTTIEAELALLRGRGFPYADILYRAGQIAVLSSRKQIEHDA